MGTEQPAHGLILDVSQYNGSAPSGAVLSALGSPALAVRISQGASQVDSGAAHHIAAARAFGVPVIAYHALTRDNPVAQAEWFVAQLKAQGLRGDTAAHAVDWELEGADLFAFIAAFRHLEPAAKLGVYASPSFYNARAAGRPFPADWAWVAQWLSEPRNGNPKDTLVGGGADHDGVTPGYWTAFEGCEHYALRQFTDAAQVGAEGPFDCSVTYLSTDDFRHALGLPPLEAAPAPTPPPPVETAFSVDPPALAHGATGLWVKKAESLLLAYGYAPHGMIDAGGAPDGVYGDTLENNIEHFQLNAKIPPSGRIDSLTWRHLISD